MSRLTQTAPDRWVTEAMDTVFSLHLPSAGAPAALVEAITADWARLEDRLSVFRPGSEISRYRAGHLASANLSPLVRQAMAACDRLEDLTGGVFSARRAGGFDPTGYVKGWALARAARRLDEAGLTAYCLNGGGDVVVRGAGPHGVPWRVGIAHPYRPGELATVVTALDTTAPLAVATSGTAERGQHVVNPLTGWRPTHSAVTVVGTDIALVDAIATAALAAGDPAAAALVASLGLEALGFGEDKRPWWTPGLPAYALLPALTGPR